MKTCDISDCENERIMSWRPIGHERGYRICREHIDRHHDPQDEFDLFVVFGLSRDAPKHSDTDGFQFKRFPDFGKEMRRPFEVREECYDCAAFWEGCKGWRLRKEEKTLPCRHYQQLPDVKAGPTDWHAWVYGGARMPAYPHRPTSADHSDSGSTEQVFPEKVFVPAEPERLRSDGATKASCPTGTNVPLERKVNLIDPKRHCVCGRPVPKRRRYCDACREARKQQAMARFNRQHPKRRHRGAQATVRSTRRPVDAALTRGNS